MIRSLSASLMALTLALTPVLAEAKTKPQPRPTMAWDHTAQAGEWTQATLNAVQASRLINSVPRGIEQYCPGYATASKAERAAFWVGMMSVIAKYESTWNPRAMGGGGRYHGLMQISPATARSAGCDGKLTHGATNLQCAVRIAARKAGSGSVQRVLSDWGPMSSAKKRAAMAAFTSRQSYCQ